MPGALSKFGGVVGYEAVVLVPNAEVPPREELFRGTLKDGIVGPVKPCVCSSEIPKATRYMINVAAIPYNSSQDVIK